MYKSQFYYYNNIMKTLFKINLILYIFTIFYIALTQFHFQVIISLLLLIPLYFIHHNFYQNGYLIYIYFSHVLGTTCHFYKYPYYDKIIHFCSGIIIVWLGYLILKKEIQQKRLLYIFINCVEMSVAFLWEVFEYSGLIFFQYDASRHYTTGVHDTMQDMIISLIGGILLTYIIYKYPTYIDNLCKQPQDNLDEVSLPPHT